MKNFSLFTFDLLFCFIISSSQRDELRDKLDTMLSLGFLQRKEIGRASCRERV